MLLSYAARRPALAAAIAFDCSRRLARGAASSSGGGGLPPLSYGATEEDAAGVGLSSLSLLSAAAALHKGDTAAEVLASACGARMAAMSWTNAVVAPLEEETRSAAWQSDLRRFAGKTKGLLDGLPVVVKDNFCIAGNPATAGSRFLRDFTAPYSATVVERLQDKGAVLMARSNMDEFGMGSANTNSAWGNCLNPWVPPGMGEPRVAGGSSGGSAAAVASGMGFAALGSDTGGSVRLPAAYCGVVGMKPSYGRLSRHGLVAYCSSLDCPGILTRSVQDAAIMLAALQGQDPMDPTTVPACPDLASLLDTLDLEAWLTRVTGVTLGEPQALRHLRVGIPREYDVPGLSAAVRGALAACAEALRAGGATVELVSLPHTAAALGAYYVLSPAEASSNLSRYDGLRFGHQAEGGADPHSKLSANKAAITASRTEGFGPEVLRRIMMGTFALSSEHAEGYFRKAQRIRRLVANDFAEAFADVDVLLTPVAPDVAPSVAEAALLSPAQMYATDVMTVPASLAGLPAISMPVALDGALPIGVQLIGPRLADAKLLGCAAILQEQLMAAARA